MKFYRDNRIDGEYELSVDEIVTGFLSSEFSRRVEPVNPWLIERRMNAYILAYRLGSWDVQDKKQRGEFDAACAKALTVERRFLATRGEKMDLGTATARARAIQRAQTRFWQAIAESYPHITTGDLPPGASQAFDEACERVVSKWLRINSETNVS